MQINYLEKKRAFVLSLVFLVWILLIVVSLFRMQVLEYDRYLNKVKAQTNRQLEVRPKRGTIYDRNGEILAISIKAKSAFITNRDSAVSLAVWRRVVTCLNLTSGQRQTIEKRLHRGEHFVWLKRRMSDEEFRYTQAIPLTENEKDVLAFMDEYRRVYPQGRLASHLLGGVGIDEQPLGGIEYKLNDEIGGRSGEAKFLMDARKKVFQLRYVEPTVPGKDVHLSIDSSLQYFVERELGNAVHLHRANGGTVVVLNVEDGSVLAMASFPDFSPEDVWRASPAQRQDRAISFIYDPGSTFKVVLAAAALEKNVCYPQQVFQCNHGLWRIEDRSIRDDHPYDRLSFEDVIIHSSNVGAAKIGLRLGRRNFFDMICRFGFGHKTGIFLPGEENGILNGLDHWSDVSLAFLAHGYEISVTPLQMARVFQVIASGGLLFRPRLIEAVGDTRWLAEGGKRILATGTARLLSRILTEVVERGTGTKAKIPGMEIAGKTGTAKKIVNGRYSKHYISSFGGFLPSAAPRVTVFVAIDDPIDSYYGGDVAAPLFRTIAEKIFVYLGIYSELDKLNEIRL